MFGYICFACRSFATVCGQRSVTERHCALEPGLRRTASQTSAEFRGIALPREVGEANKVSGLRNRLGKNGFIALQGFSKLLPKRTRASACVRVSSTSTSTRISVRTRLSRANPRMVGQFRFGLRGWNSSSTDCFGSLI
jgi:hypothetical protein